MRGIIDTYAPVVAFPTVRLFFIMSIILKWKTCSIDFSNAFVQAKRVDDVYMCVPCGFRTSKESHILKLIRSLYGAKDAPKLWFELLSKALISEGFTQSGLDACLWYRKDIFFVLCVDDCGIAAKSEAIIDQLITNLNAKNFKLTKEETFNEFLGISYDTMQNGDIHLVQKVLIKKVIYYSTNTSQGIIRICPNCSYPCFLQHCLSTSWICFTITQNKSQSLLHFTEFIYICMFQCSIFII